jgi:hypothetical protein
MNGHCHGSTMIASVASQAAARGWRIELREWPRLPYALRHAYLRIVGACEGEWWGEGRSEFHDVQHASACLDDVRCRLGLNARLIFWLGSPLAR